MPSNFAAVEARSVDRKFQRAMERDDVGRAMWLLLWHNFRVKRREWLAKEAAAQEQSLLYGNPDPTKHILGIFNAMRAISKPRDTSEM